VGPPAIAQQPSDVATLAGATIGFESSASGSPAPAVEWERSDDGGATWQPVAGGSQPSISLTASLEDDGARFRATFTNELGSASTRVALLTVASALPDAPAAPTAIAGEAAVTLSWTAPFDGGSPITGYTVTPSIGGQPGTPIDLAGTATTHTVGDLDPSQRYTFTVAAKNGGGVGPSSGASAAVWPHRGLPQLRIGDVRANEGDPVALVPVSLSRPTDVVVTVKTVASTADAADFEPITAQAVTFAIDGPTTQWVPITLIDDQHPELTEVLRVQASAPTAKVTRADLTATVEIVDDDGLPPQIRIADVASVDEGGIASFVVTVDGTLERDLEVSYSTNPASAGPGDITAASGTIALVAGEVDPVRTIDVPITDDGAAEGVETFSVSLGAAPGLVSADRTATAWIAASDGGSGALPPLPRIRMVDARVTEGEGAVDVEVAIDQSADATVQVATTAGKATAGDDFAATTTTVAFVAGGPTTQIVTIPVSDDGLGELEEAFTVRASRPMGALLADNAATVTVLDDDPVPPQARISDAIATEGQALAFEVAIDGALDRSVTLELTLVDGSASVATDLGIPSTVTVTFPAGSIDPSERVTIEAIDDGVAEPDEQFTVRLASDSVIRIADASGIGIVRSS
jgi:hypothetical protein